MAKRMVTNIAGVGIIYRASNPAEIFIEVKDDGHPIKLVRRQMCFIGGNWIGEGAKDDINPFATFARELGEEMSFDRPTRSSVELGLLGLSSVEHFEPAPLESVEVTDRDRKSLDGLKKTIVGCAVPFGDFLITIEKVALDAADSANKRDGWTSLASYWAVPLDENAWAALCALQTKFGNLSNESLTVITSLDEIVRNGIKTAFAHDRVLQRFFLKHGLPAAENLPLVSNVSSVEAGPSFPTYANYLERYDVLKRPSGT